jgi:endonuclease/exonuclease/phosphatase family metal-dependent hydrolase
MRLLSYNIHKGIGGRDRRYRFERIIEVLEHENADIVCLQEVDRHVRRSRHDDQPQLLVDYFTPAAHRYQLNVHLKEGGYGNLIFSRWPLTADHRICLRQGKRKPRGAQLAVIDTPEGPLHLVHWHLGLAERERHWQVQHLLEHQLFCSVVDVPTLVVGDFNDWRNTLARTVFEPRQFTHVTAPAYRFRSFPAYMPLGALDKAFCRGAVTIRHARTVRTRMTKQASDHLPLVIDFHLNGHG